MSETVGTYLRDTWFVPEKEIAPSDAVYADGDYEGTGYGIGFGYGGDDAAIPVTVTVKDGKIAQVTPGDHNETPDLGGLAIQYLAGRVVEANGTDGVDAVASATLSSNGFLNAVNEALDQAKA